LLALSEEEDWPGRSTACILFIDRRVLVNTRMCRWWHVSGDWRNSACTWPSQWQEIAEVASLTPFGIKISVEQSASHLHW